MLDESQIEHLSTKLNFNFKFIFTQTFNISFMGI